MTTNHVPCDIKELSPWLNVIRRLRSVTYTSSGYAILTIRVLVDADGTPIQWTAPSVTLLEPKSETTTVDVLLTTLAP